jgi:release factor glutamine methyltransferase
VLVQESGLSAAGKVAVWRTGRPGVPYAPAADVVVWPTMTDTWTVGRLLEWTTDYLNQHGADSARLDAELLLGRARKCPRIALYTAWDELVDEAVRTEFRELVRQRAEGTPVAYLLGYREFYSLKFRVTPDVLIPRPETEHLVVTLLELAKQHCGDQEQVRIADVGTGSGVIAVCVAKHLPRARVTAIDISAAALAVAQDNARRHDVLDRLTFVQSDLLEGVGTTVDGTAGDDVSGDDIPSDDNSGDDISGEDISGEDASGQFDFIVSNPPYIGRDEMDELATDVRDHEPHTALFAGPRGTDVVERLVPEALARLRPGGFFLCEIAPRLEDEIRSFVGQQDGFELQATVADLAGLPRVVVARKNPA